MRTRTVLVAGAVLAGSLAAVAVAVSSAGAGDTSDDLASIRNATSRYRDLGRAIEDGYVQFFGCVHEPLAGAMGTHFVNGQLVGDTVIDATQPEALIYDLNASNRADLLGAEYVVFKEAWDAEHDQPPTLFGETFKTVEAPNRYGIPAFYELHAWAWQDNPTGDHEDWNPKVLCPTTEGHAHAPATSPTTESATAQAAPSGPTRAIVRS